MINGELHHEHRSAYVRSLIAEYSEDSAERAAVGEMVNAWIKGMRAV